MTSQSTLVQVNFRIEQSLLAELEAAAKSENRGKGNIIVTSLQQYFQAKANQAGQIDAILTRLNAVEERLGKRDESQEDGTPDASSN